MNKKDLLFLLFIFVGGLILIIGSLSQTIFGGDSAEFATTLVNWGISHPPGYPFYTLLGNIFVRLLPFSNIYLKISLLSAISTLITGFLIYKVCLLLYQSKTISLFAAIFFFFLFPVWFYSIVPEVFALAVLLVVFQFYLLLNLTQNRLASQKAKIFYLILFALSLGLSFAHHHLFIFFLPSYIYLIAKSKDIKNIVLENKYKLLAWALVPSFFYLYLPIVSFFTNNLSIEDNTTISGILNTITRAPYGTFKAYVWAQENFLNRVFDAFSPVFFILHDFKPLGLILIILGFFYLFRYQRIVFNFFLINFASLSFFFFYANYYLNLDFTVATVERFLFFLYAIAIFPFAGGILFLYKILEKIILEATNKKIVLYLSKGLLIFLLLFLLIQNLAKNYPLMAYVAKNKIFENYGTDIIKTPEKNSILILTGDNSLFITNHLTQVKKLRKDLIIITPGYLSRKHIKAKLIKKYPQVFFPEKDVLDWDKFFSKNFQKGNLIYSDKPLTDDIWLPYGLLWKYYPDANTAQKEKNNLRLSNKKLWNDGYHIPILRKDERDILFLLSLQNEYLDRYANYGRLLVLDNQLDEAKNIFEKILQINRNHINSLISMIEIYYLQNNCPQAKKNLSQIKEKEFLDDVNHLKIILKYFKICDSQNDKIYQYLEIYNKLRQTEEISLDKL